MEATTATHVAPRLDPAWLRLIVLFAVCAVVGTVLELVNGAVASVPPVALPVGVATAAAMVWVYVRVTGWLERRRVSEFGRQGARSGLVGGFAFGLGLFVATVAVIGAFGDFRITGWGSFGAFVSSAGLLACAAVVEEVLLRGVVFRLVEQTASVSAADAVLFAASPYRPGPRERPAEARRERRAAESADAAIADMGGQR